MSTDKQTLLMANGKSDWVIVTGANASPGERFAAKELGDWLEKAGARLPERTDDEPETPYEIVIGATRRVCAGEREPLRGGREDEDANVVITETQIHIEGSGARGTLYGVYAFLEDFIGVRWFTRDVSHVPHKGAIDLKLGSRYFEPYFMKRMYAFKCQRMDADFVSRCRLNMSPTDGLTDKHGIPKLWDRALGHSIDDMVPDELYGAHPEYFPEINAHRVHGKYHQRCLTNPDVLKLAIDYSREQLKANPEQTMFAIGQADTYPDKPNNCMCAQCRAVDEEEGSPMGSLLRFVNAVADALKDEFPNVLFSTLAYRYTRKPPLFTRPAKNVCVVLCSIEGCFSHAFDSNCGANYMDGPIGQVGNEAFVADVARWSSICKHLFIWDYVTNFPHYLAPHANFHTLGANMRFFARHNVCGVYPEGSHDCEGAADDEQKSYQLARLMLNPESDDRLDSAEFLIGMLGVAAAPILEYQRMLSERVEKKRIHMSTYHTPDINMFPREFVDKADALFDRAELLAETDDILARIKRMRMSIRYVKLYLYQRTLPLSQRRQIAEEFLSDMRKLNISSLFEGGKMQGAEERVKLLLRL